MTTVLIYSNTQIENTEIENNFSFFNKLFIRKLTGQNTCFRIKSFLLQLLLFKLFFRQKLKF
jgi:hypothetical protein